MSESSLAQLDEARKMLARIKTVDDARRLINLAEAARVYARKVELGQEAQNHAAEIKIRAQRKLGELTVAMPREAGMRPDLTSFHDQKRFTPLL